MEKKAWETTDSVNVGAIFFKRMEGEITYTDKELRYKELLDTALACELPIINFDKCCKLLATCFCIPVEAFTFNAKMHFDLDYAANRFRFSGGETPDEEAAEYIRELIAEIKDFEKIDRENGNMLGCERPEWVIQLFNSYNEKVPYYRI